MTPQSPISAIATLDDDLRRGMYQFIRRAGRAVTRDEAAEAVGISRKLAAFHLDKLVDAGLLVADLGTPPAVRRAGRRPKTYLPAPGTDLQVSIPPRRHGLLAELLLEAVATEQQGESPRAAAVRAAREHGERLGADGRRRTRGRIGAERALTLASTVLEENDFEPVRRDAGRVRLRSCPFHPLAAKDTELVCGMNHALLEGLVSGLGTSAVEAVLDPAGGECCVELRARTRPAR